MISLGDSSFQKMEVLTMNVLSSVHTLMAGNRCLRKLQTINLYCMLFAFNMRISWNRCFRRR